MEELNAATNILTFVLDEQTGDAVIDNINHTIAIEVEFGTDLSSLTPVFQLSEGATSDPFSGTSIDFSNQVTIVVTAEDGTTTQDWIVTVTEDSETPDTDTDILSFILDEQTGDAVIDNINHTIAIEVEFGTDLSSLISVFQLSEGATSDPVSGTSIDFRNQVTIVVTAEDGTTTQDWTVTVTEDSEAPDTDTDILSFVLDEQTGDAVIDDINHTIAIEVEFGTDLSSLTPVFQLSEGATSDPVSGTSIDFSNQVIIVVTAEDGTTTQDWTVAVAEDSETPDTNTDILSFLLDEQAGDAEIDDINHTITIEVEFGTDLSNLTPAFQLSEGATSDPVSGTSIDFSNQVTIVVTAEDGVTTQDWTVSVIIGSNPLSVKELINMEVYPNPVVNVLNVSTEMKVTMSLFDLQGRMKQPKITGQDFQIDMTEYSDGIYLLILEMKDQIMIRRISKY